MCAAQRLLSARPISANDSSPCSATNSSPHVLHFARLLQHDVIASAMSCAYCSASASAKFVHVMQSIHAQYAAMQIKYTESTASYGDWSPRAGLGIFVSNDWLGLKNCPDGSSSASGWLPASASVLVASSPPARRVPGWACCFPQFPLRRRPRGRHRPGQDAS